MSYLYHLISQQQEKKEQLVRLRNAHSHLNALQGEFLHLQSSVTLPELSSSTWQGELARTFMNIREDMLLSYKDISHHQMDTALTSVEDKISSIQSEIQSLETSIANEQARIEREQRKDR